MANDLSIGKERAEQERVAKAQLAQNLLAAKERAAQERVSKTRAGANQDQDREPRSVCVKQFLDNKRITLVLFHFIFSSVNAAPVQPLNTFQVVELALLKLRLMSNFSTRSSPKKPKLRFKSRTYMHDCCF